MANMVSATRLLLSQYRHRKLVRGTAGRKMIDRMIQFRGPECHMFYGLVWFVRVISNIFIAKIVVNRLVNLADKSSIWSALGTG